MTEGGVSPSHYVFSDYEKTYVPPGCVDSSPTSAFYSGSGSVYLTLARGLSEFAGSTSTGSSCQTLPGTFPSLTAQSFVLSSSWTGGTSVVASISCAGLTIGVDYEITVTLTRRDSGTDAFISTTQAVITFTADATTDTVDYNVPIEAGTKVNFDSADSIVAA